jgi:hypothetical protein
MALETTLGAQPALVVSSVKPFWLPLRNLIITVALTLLSFAVSGFIWSEKGFEMLIVGMGWAHILLGFGFMFGRVLRDEPNARSSFAVLSAATLGIALLHYSVGITFFIYLYFFFHAFRDEVMMYFQTSSGHNSKLAAYSLKGLIPAILLLLVIAQPTGFRQNVRRVEFPAQQLHSNGWTAINFEPIPDSKDREYYFSLHAPGSKGKEGVRVAKGLSPETSPGEMVVGDRRDRTNDLVFAVTYDGRQIAEFPDNSQHLPENGVELGGENRIGQTFTAQHDQLSGIWLRTAKASGVEEDMNFVFRLASPPMLHLDAALATLRNVLIVVFAAIFLWQVAPTFVRNRSAWSYIVILVMLLIAAHQIIRPSAKLGYVVPMLFQLIVVFHYFSWYVFSYSKFSALKKNESQRPQRMNIYDRFLWNLRDRTYFTFAIILLNVVSFAGVFWFYSGRAPEMLGYLFNYNYFIYFLVLHVTFSFNPERIFVFLGLTPKLP